MAFCNWQPEQCTQSNDCYLVFRRSVHVILIGRCPTSANKDHEKPCESIFFIWAGKSQWSFTPTVQLATPTVNYLKTKQSVSIAIKGSLFLCRHPSCPTHGNKIHCPFKPCWARMHTALSEQHPWAKLCGSCLVLMEYPCTQHVLRPKHRHKFVSSSTRPASSLLPIPGSIKSSSKVTEAPLPWSLSHHWFLTCLQVYEQRFPFLVLAPQTCKDISSSMYITTTRADGALESWTTSLWTQSILFPLPSAFPVTLTSA